VFLAHFNFIVAVAKVSRFLAQNSVLTLTQMGAPIHFFKGLTLILGYFEPEMECAQFYHNARLSLCAEENKFCSPIVNTGDLPSVRSILTIFRGVFKRMRPVTSHLDQTSLVNNGLNI